MQYPEPTPHPKLIYFAHRPNNIDRENFISRWRRHARLGMSMPRWKNIHRYVHCDALSLPEGSLPVAWCDGVAIIWYRSEQARLEHISDQSAGPILKQDELETFARPVQEVSVLTDETTFKPFGTSSLKLFLRVWRNSDQNQKTFRNWWLCEFGPNLLERLNKSNVCRGYSQNHARALTPHGGKPLLCDCVDEIACDDARVCEHLIKAALGDCTDKSHYLRDIKAIWTRQTVLFGG